MTPKDVIVRLKRLENGKALELPSYQTSHSNGMDLPAAISAAVVISPGQRLSIATGFALEIPEGFDGQVRPRSGLAVSHGLTVLNSPGTRDADYRGEVKVLIVNLGCEPVTIKPGDRRAQLVIAPTVSAFLLEVDELAPSTRGGGGFGHTGR